MDEIIIAAIAGIVTIIVAALPFIFARLKEIHILVNSSYGTSLTVGAIALRELAKAHPHDKQIKERAELAERLLLEHEKKQTLVDKK